MSLFMTMPLLMPALYNDDVPRTNPPTSPDIISRGFVYLRDNKDLMDQTRLIIRKSVETSMRNPRAADLDNARDDLAESVSRFLLQRTLKRPIVIPVIVGV